MQGFNCLLLESRGIGYSDPMDGRELLSSMAQWVPNSIRFVARHIELFMVSGLVVVAAVQYTVRPQSQSYQQIIDSGVLRVLVSDEPDAQFMFDKQHYGFEYEMLATFARSLDVELEIEVVPFGEIFSLLDNGVADLAVGGIIDTEFVGRVSQPSIPWYQARSTVVYQRGTKRPRNLQDLQDQTVLASARYFGLEALQELQLKDDHRSEYELLTAVANGRERFVLSTNYRAKNAKHYLPDLNRGFLLPDSLSLVWSLPKRHDPALRAVLDQFLQIALDRGLPGTLADYYLALPNRLSTFDILALHKRIKQVLPEYEYAFRKAARRGGIDWQLLAAMAYQESRWSNDARSPTGVRGIMQLTNETAEFLGVENRMDMSQSINAAGDYILFLKSKLPRRIEEPQRTWFAVGAYNMGLKHILYAYRKAREMRLERTQWNTISQLLPSLYGRPFAQGRQARDYVERIQIFTDIIRFYDLHQRDSFVLEPNVALIEAEEATEP